MLSPQDKRELIIDTFKNMGAENEFTAPKPLRLLLRYAETYGEEEMNNFVERLFMDNLTRRDREFIMGVYYPVADKLSRKAFVSNLIGWFAAGSMLVSAPIAVTYNVSAQNAPPADRQQRHETAGKWLATALCSTGVYVIAYKKWRTLRARMHEIEDGAQFQHILQELPGVVMPVLDETAEKLKRSYYPSLG